MRRIGIVVDHGAVTGFEQPVCYRGADVAATTD
jgi:hypothetical protein